MNDSELSRLFAAERAEAPSTAQTARCYEALQAAVHADLPALPVAHGPLSLGLSLGTKSLLSSGLVAFAVTTAGLGVHASLQEPAASPAQVVVSAAPVSAVTVVTSVADVVDEKRAPDVALLGSAVPAPARPKSSIDSASTFAEELRLIKAAKQELDAGRAHLARVWLDQHARLYPNGTFRTERTELQRRLSSGPPPAADFPETGER